MTDRMRLPAAALALTMLLGNSAAAKPLTFGVVPEQSLDELAKKWQPILDAVSKEAGFDIRFDRSNSNIESFYKKFNSGGYDMAFVNPMIFANAPPGLYQPIVHQDGKLQGIVVIDKSSPIRSLKELRGKRIVFPSPESFAATLLIEHEFEKAGVPVSELKIRFAGNHDKVYQAVASGQADAGGGVIRTFNQQDSQVLDHLRILHTSLPVVPHPFVINNRSAGNLAPALRRAFLKLSSTPEGVAMLRKVGMGELVEAHDSEYDSLHAETSKR